MRVSRAGVATLLAGVLAATLLPGPATAQVDRLPPYLQETLAQIGPVFQRDINTYIPMTLDAFQPILRSAPKDGVTVTADQHYGPDPKQVLDVYRPTPRQGAPILIYVHGGAYVTPPYSRSAALMLCRTTSGDRRGASGGATRLSGGLCVR